jgi:hypothetical protein
VLHCVTAVAGNSWQSITVNVTANAVGPCNTTIQRQLADSILKQLTANTAPQYASYITLVNATCTSSAQRQFVTATAAPTDVVSTFSYVAATVGLPDSVSGLQTALTEDLGPTFTLGEHCLSYNYLVAS